MSFIVEDGSMPPNANSFASLAFFRDYVTDRNYTVQMAWTDAQIQANLIRATDFFQARYSLAVTGFPVTQQQSLCFPRNQCRKQQGADGFGMNAAYGAIDVYIPATIVPLEVQKAVCELAITADSGMLMPDIAKEDYNTISEKIGPISTDYTRSSRLAYNLFRAAAMYIQPFIVSGGSGVKMVRS